ncbi:MAG: ATP phosphoribosyltransferase regulatory subunit, partial [Candidatus Bathyarchaeia archaeon]
MNLKNFLKPHRGMKDYLPRDLYERRVVEEAIRELFKLYGYEEVETPTVEYYELLAAKVGEETRKTMYVFKDLAGRTLALRPEGTVPIVRLVASKLRTAPKPLRLGYIWDFYRYDEPQKGRYRR